MKFIPFWRGMPLWLFFILSPFIKESDTLLVHHEVEKHYFEEFIKSRLLLTEEEKTHLLSLVVNEGEIISPVTLGKAHDFLISLARETATRASLIPKEIPLWRSLKEKQEFHLAKAATLDVFKNRLIEIQLCCEILIETTTIEA